MSNTRPPRMPVCDDPFSPEADPDRAGPATAWRAHGAPAPIAATQAAPNPIAATAPQACSCGALSRRTLLQGLGSLTLLPVAADAQPFERPCVQKSRHITPCRHKFCRHYGGENDYYGR